MTQSIAHAGGGGSCEAPASHSYIMFWHCLSNSVRHPFPHDYSKGFSTIKLKLASPWAAQEAYLSWRYDLDFQGHRGHKGQILFPQHDSKRFRAINLRLGTNTCLRSNNRSIHFGVTVVNFWVFLEHNCQSSRPITLKHGTDTCLDSGNMLIHFGVSGFNLGVNFGVTGTNRSAAINLKLGTDTWRWTYKAMLCGAILHSYYLEIFPLGFSGQRGIVIICTCPSVHLSVCLSPSPC